MRWVLVYVLVAVVLLLGASTLGLLGVGEQVAALTIAGALTYGLLRWSRQSPER